MPRFSQEEPGAWSELLEDVLDAADLARQDDERRRRVDLESRLRVARMMADGPLRDEAGA